MPKITYFIKLTSNVVGSAALQDGLELQTVVEIPDKHDENELNFLVNRIKQDLPYFYYQHEVNAECSHITIDYTEKVVEFKIYGDNIGKQQEEMMKRSYEWSVMTMEKERAKMEFLHGEEKKKAHGILDRLLDKVKRTTEWLKELVFPKPEPKPISETKSKLKPLEVSFDDPIWKFFEEETEKIRQEQKQKEDEAARSAEEARRKQEEAEQLKELEKKVYALKDKYIDYARERRSMAERWGMER